MRLPAYEEGGKRVCDLVVSTVAIAVLMPVMVFVSAAIAIEDGFPVIFRQSRGGKGGSTFEVLKFRSMPLGTASITSSHAAALRVTAVGRFIRRTNLDELPQLINVVRGDMSLVGPRPPLPTERNLIELRRASGALDVLPGLTGLAQVNSYDGMPTEEKAAWDARYAARISLATDLRTIARTFLHLLRRPPTY